MSGRKMTFKSSVRVNAPIKQVSVHDLPGFTKLKVRQTGQNTEEEVKKRNLAEELQKKEKEAQEKRVKEEEGGVLATPSLPPPVEENKSKIFNLDADDSGSESSESESEDEKETKKESKEESNSGESSDEDEDTKELMKELERIKKEREEEAKRKELEQKAKEAQEREKAMLNSNPLLSEREDFNIKKRWYDDAIFKNQAQGETAPKQQKRFINDTIRNDFHKKFLNKYIK